MIKIYYFSSTGNSLWSAKKIAQIIKEEKPSEICELHNVGKVPRKSTTIIEADAVILIFPSYAYGMPRVMRNFVKTAVFKTPYIASFVTYGTSPRGTMGDLRRILEKKRTYAGYKVEKPQGIGKMFFGEIPAVENYLAIFGTPAPETIEERCKMQETATLEAAHSFLEKKENKVSTFTPFSTIVWSLFWFGIKLFYIFYKVGKHCNGCSICEKVCPVDAIQMKNGKPHFTSKCEHCQACLNLCPLRAIQFSRVRFGTPGYCHPEININELMK